MERIGKLAKIVDALPLKIPGHFIGGKWQTYENRGQEKLSYNPSNGHVLAKFSWHNQVLGDACKSAEQAFSLLGECSFAEKVAHISKLRAYIQANEDLFIDAMRLEAGKPLWEARKECQKATDYLSYVLASKDQLMDSLLAVANLQQNSKVRIKARALGICAGYLSFTGVLTSYLTYAVASILTGCPLIVFSSTQGCLQAYLLAEMEKELMQVPGALSLVFGGYEEFRLVSAMESIRAVFYTGSKEHCDLLHTELKEDRSRQLVLQSGGKNTVLVHSTADIEQAVAEICYGAFKSAGQLCSATSRVFVYRSLLGQFKEAMLARISSMTVGRTDLFEEDQDPQMGPLYSRKAVEKFLRFQTMANREAESVWHYGAELALSQEGGFFVSPAVRYLSKVDKKSPYQRNILFSPDLAIYSYDILNHVIEDINQVEPSFSLAFFGDQSILEDRAHLFKSPNLLANKATVERDFCLPLACSALGGGLYYSGLGMARYLIYPQALL